MRLIRRLGLGRQQGGVIVPQLNTLLLTPATVVENTAAGTLVGALTNTQSGSSFSLTDTAGSRFALSGTNINTGATGTNFEGATSHNITVRETNASYPNSPRDSVISIAVTNVFEAASLAALTLSDAAFVTGTSESGTIIGATSGSTITGSGLPTGFTINGPARTWVWDGLGSVSTPSITLTETLADSANSPRQSVIGLTITALGGVTGNPPTLSLTSNTTYPPPLEVLLDETVLENDVLRVQSSATLDFASPIINDTSVLDAAAIASGNISVTGLSSISSPTQTYFRARIERGGVNSAYSNIVKHGDTVAATITSSSTPSVAEFTVAGSGLLTANEDIALWEISGGADAGSFSITGNQWTLDVVPDYETKSSYAVQFRATDYGGNLTTQDVTVSITDVDDTPNALGFTDVPSATLNTLYTSNTITIAGLAASLTVPVTITNGEYSKNGGAFTSAAGTATNGDTFAVRQTSSALNSTTVNVVLRVGETSDTYSIISEPSASLPSIAATANPAQQNIGYGTNDYTFAAQSIGAAAATRIVVVAVDFYAGGAGISSVTIGGIAATLISSAADNVIYSAIVPTGTTADIQVVGASSFAFLGIQVVALYDSNATPTDTQALAYSFSSPPFGVTVTTATNGFTIIQIIYQSTTAPTWSGATAAFSRNNGSETTALAYTQTSGFKGVTGVPSANNFGKSVSFQP